MSDAQTIAAALFGACSLFLILGNHIHATISRWRKKSFSFVPFFGGLSGAVAMWIAPIDGLWRVAWIPLLADVTIPGAILVFAPMMFGELIRKLRTTKPEASQPSRLRVIFSRAARGAVLTCARPDGTQTYAVMKQGEFFRRHDALHFAVESVLARRSSFFGLIAAGWAIEDFSLPGVTQRLPAEAVETEFIVGYLEQEWVQGRTPTAADLERYLDQALTPAQRAHPAPSAEQVEQILAAFAKLEARLRALTDRQSVELEF